MTVAIEKLQTWLDAKEDEHLEFKEAKAKDDLDRGQPVPDFLKSRVDHLLEQGIIERIGRGRGVRLLLSQHFYRHLGKSGMYTRRHGLDRETNKQLLLKHIRDNATEGHAGGAARVLPALSRRSIQGLLGSLRREGRIQLEGKTRAGRWHPGDVGGSNRSSLILPKFIDNKALINLHFARR